MGGAGARLTEKGSGREFEGAAMLGEIGSQEEIHDVLRSGTLHMPQIAFPYSPAIGVLDNLITRKVVHVIMRRRPFLSDGSQERLGISVSDYHVHC